MLLGYVGGYLNRVVSGVILVEVALQLTTTDIASSDSRVTVHFKLHTATEDRWLGRIQLRGHVANQETSAR
jgi:hypothetical protein